MLHTGAPETYAPPGTPTPGAGIKACLQPIPSAKTLLLKRENRPPGYSENAVRKEEEQTGDPAAAVDLRSSENIKLDRVRLRDDAPADAGAKTR